MKFKFSKQAGNIRLWGLAVIAMAALFGYGGQELYTALRNRTPTVLSYDDFLRKKPDAEWLRLTNCVLNVGDSIYMQDKETQEISELLIPVESPGEDGPRIHVLLASEAPKHIATIKEIFTLITEERAKSWISKNRDRMLPHGDIEGVVRFGLKMRESKRQELVAHKHNLDADVIIIEDGTKPNLPLALAMVGGGLLILGAGLTTFFRQKNA